MVEIRISELIHEFDDRVVLRSISFTSDGPSLAITGPNGSGKSTLLRIIAGLLTPSSGAVTVSVDGHEVPAGDLRYIMGLAAPDVRLYPDLTPRENLRFLLEAKAITCRDSWVDETLDQVGLGSRADDRVCQLSSGLRQRAALAAALVHRPRLLLLDEPSTNLDEAGVRMVRDAVDAQKLSGMVVIATNDSREVEMTSACLDLGARQ